MKTTMILSLLVSVMAIIYFAICKVFNRCKKISMRTNNILVKIANVAFLFIIVLGVTDIVLFAFNIIKH